MSGAYAFLCLIVALSALVRLAVFARKDPRPVYACSASPPSAARMAVSQFELTHSSRREAGDPLP